MSEWIVNSLGELVSFQKGRKVTTSSFLLKGYEPYLGAGALSGELDGYASSSFAVRANEKDILMLWDGERSGLCRSGLKGVVSSTVCKLTPKKIIRSDFLYYLLANNYEWIQARRTGTGVPHVPKDIGRILEIKFPTCLETQKKIATILMVVDNLSEKKKFLIKKYQKIKTGMMHDLFTRGVCDNGELRPSAQISPGLYKETPIGLIPKSWTFGTINSCGSVKLGRQRSPDKHSGRWTMPYLRVANVYDGFFELDDVLEMDFSPNEREVFSVRKGDILLNEGQSLELVGRSALYQGENDKYCFQNTLIRFRCYQNGEPSFFRQLFKYYLDTGVFMRIASQTTSVAHLGAERFANLLCPIIPFEEQCLISSSLRTIDDKIQTENDELSKIKNIKKALMHDLLTGNVPVKLGSKIIEASHV